MPVNAAQEQAKTRLPILEEKEVVKWRDENEVVILARKCKCGSVWCESYSCVKPWIERTSRDLVEFDWKRTREIVLTVDPGKFENGKEAYDYIRDHKLIPGFLRNIQRGKRVKAGKNWIWKYRPVQITKWMTFLEWHKNGFPHWHVFIETVEYGRFSRIGGDMIRHYWPVARWVKENFIRSQKHWDYQLGHFEKKGYFHKSKQHQTRLPTWALEIPGLRIRRSTHSRREGEIQKDEFDGIPALGKGWNIDPETGEILKPEIMTYGKRLDLCGKRTFLTVYTKQKEVDGLFDIPYQEVKKDHPGEYREGVGYLFSVNEGEAEKLLTKMIRGKEIGYLKKRYSEGREVIKHWCSICGDWTYQKIKEARDYTDLYLCLRCKTGHEYKEREQEKWRA